MSELPSGIVAFVMTDVEASTEGWNRSGPAMEDALGALDAAVTAIVTAHGGSVVKARGEGDSHFAAFARASDAVGAVVALQRRPDDRLSVRACVLVGEAQPRRDDYVGAIVNYGARIRSAAHGGQVIVTRPVVDLVTINQGDLSFLPLGMHRLRDVPDPVELHQLCGPGLRRTFPPLHTTAFTASVLMAVVVADEAGASRRFHEPDDDLLRWQRGVIRLLTDLADRHHGRFVKLVGDGCVVGFEDPRAAIAFADDLEAPFRAGIALGLVDVVEGELVGRPIFDAVRLMRAAGPGEVRCSPAIDAVLAGAR